MGVDWIYYAYLAVAAVSAATTVYSQKQAQKSQEQAAAFNARNARKAAEIKADDDRTNALRRREQHRKYLASVKARKLEQGQLIEGGNRDFLDEAVGNLELRVLDDSVRSQRAQAAYQNQAFQYDWQGQQASDAGRINTVATAIDGVASAVGTGYNQGWFYNTTGAPKATVVN